MKLKSIFIVCAVLFLTTTSFAHEYWFEPERFVLNVNETTPVHLFVGDGLVKDKEERPFQLAKTPVFKLFDIDQSWDLVPTIKDGTMPFYSFKAEKPGNYLLAMERNWSFIRIESKKFEDYLREDGMEYVIAERKKLGEQDKEGRERYSRYLKSLLQVGDTRTDIYKKTLGQRLEIMPLENPYSRKVGDALRFQIFFDSKPLVGYVVFADNRGSTTQKMTTDKSGKFSMKIDRTGLWLVRMVVMRRCTEKDCGDADWQSFWGALSFGIEK